jgi:hypothetical protein
MSQEPDSSSNLPIPNPIRSILRLVCFDKCLVFVHCHVIAHDVGPNRLDDTASLWLVPDPTMPSSGA